MMKQVFLGLLLVISVLSQNAFALGDVAAGKIKAAVCGGCHGLDGNSLVATYPKLAGQNERYIVEQLAAFKANVKRKNTLMLGMATPLSKQDAANLGAYFQSQKIKSTAPFDAAKIARGRELYNGGDLQKHIPACKACHGPTGAGNAGSGYPQLTGQYVPYVVAQLKAFKAGTRTNDVNKVMRVVVDKLSDDDIQSLANYIASLKQ